MRFHKYYFIGSELDLLFVVELWGRGNCKLSWSETLSIPICEDQTENHKNVSLINFINEIFFTVERDIVKLWQSHSSTRTILVIKF
jgi:hypothetical protein